MISDFTESNDLLKKDYDICIIGGGAAGITLALKLDKKLNICLLESLDNGDEKFKETSEEVYDGNVIGDEYFDLRYCRVRSFGGSTNHWGGYMMPLDRYDLTKKDFLSENYWPIKFNELEKYNIEARKLFKVSDFEKNKKLNGAIEIFYKEKPIRFSYEYKNYFRNSKNIELIFNSNLIDLNIKNNRILNVKCSNYNHFTYEIKSKIFIFAMGGIENCRFLSWFNEKYFKNRIMPIGNYWMEHPHNISADAILYDKINSTRYFKIPEDKKIKNKIANCIIGLEPRPRITSKTKEIIREIACINPTLGKNIISKFNKNLYCHSIIRTISEQQPIKENKIILQSKKDYFGVPKSELYWKKNSFDLRTVKKSLEEFAYFLTQNKLGSLGIKKIFYQGSFPKDEISGGNHHMGGTIMGTDKNKSVCDENLKFWDLNNLYIAGSSVFPTSGAANPTFTIVQLALRLADHLNKKNLN